MKVGAVHAAPVFMDKSATITKAIGIIDDAAKQGVELLIFPEVFIPGWPALINAYAPVSYRPWVLEYIKQSVLVYESASPEAGGLRVSADVQLILDACRQANMNVVVGVSERSSFSSETLFNSQLFISNTGRVLGTHRKLVPTFAERSIWAHGGGATLRCWDAPLPDGGTFKIGGLACGENLNLGAMLALVNLGEQVHAASWPHQCALAGLEASWKAIKLRAEAHSSAVMCFTIAASSISSQEELRWMEEHFGKQSVVGRGSGWSGIVAPDGSVLAEECGGLEERLVVGEIDLASIPKAKMLNDPAGHYRRPEVLSLHVNREPVWEDDAVAANGMTGC